MTDHNSRIALLIGGSRGIGRETVLELARRGVGVIFTYETDESAAREVLAAADPLSGAVTALQLDVRDTDALGAFADAVRADLGRRGADRLDALVNNAGMWLTASFEETSVADLDRLYEINIRGVFFVTQALLPLLRDGGRILNLSSGLVRFEFPKKIAYALSKGAIEPFTRYLAAELGPRGITVNSIAPGATATDFSGGVIRDDPEYRKRVGAITALGRPADPDDIAPAIAALLSDDLHWMNGERVEVSGGMRL